MKMRLSALTVFFFFLVASSFSQTTLEFNQVLLVTTANNTVTVPPGKVWKIENRATYTSVYVSSLSSYGSYTWTVGTPNPCTGATSGTTSGIPYVSYGSCNTNDNYIEVNSTKINWNGNAPMWLPAGTTVRINETPCRNLTGVNYNNSQVYYDSNTGLFKCGPYVVTSGGSVANGNMLSIIEFNVLP